jgi:flagellar hook-associated protein 1 FlgK
LTSQIAKANREIADLENVQRDASPFIDQRDQLIEQLSNLIDVASVRTESGLTLTTSSGTALVASAQSFPLTTQPDLSGAQHIFAQDADITAQISSGKLAGLLQARDQRIPGLLTSLDSLAAGFATAINTAHQNGFDLGGDMGGVFFAAPPAGGVGAAASMAVAITDPSLIAASSDGNPGSNGNLLALSAVHDLAVTAGATATDFYSNLVFAIGGDVANGTADQEASALVLQQLQDQRGSISGVSLDEEAANMLVFQRAYDAAARVVSAINEMMTVAVNLGR